METAQFKIETKVEETDYHGISKWRFLGAKSKSRNIYNLATNNKISRSRILEVGSGDGSILAWLDGLNFCDNVYALDISKSGVETIKSRNIPSITEVKQFDGYKIPYADNYFDIAVLSHVLEHVEYERILLRELQRVSKFQIIEVPIDYHDNADKTWVKFDSYGHINLYTPTKLRFLLKSEGFKVVDDCLGLIDLETAEYSHFENSHRERTSEALHNFRLQYNYQIENFIKMPKSEQEKNSSFYTVLTYKLSQEELLNEYLEEAYAYCAVNNKGVAKMIIDHLISRKLNGDLILPAWVYKL